MHESSASLCRVGLEVCLPRLALHLTASTVQLLRTLLSAKPSPHASHAHHRQQRRHTRSLRSLSLSQQLDDLDPVDGLSGDGPADGGAGGERGHPVAEGAASSVPPRTVVLQFSAPDMMLRLLDDVHGRHLVDAAVGGLAGSLQSTAGGHVAFDLQVLCTPKPQLTGSRRER